MSFNHYVGRVVLKDRRGALFLTILAGVLWGTSFPVIKIGLEFVDPYMFVFLENVSSFCFGPVNSFLNKEP
jgi:drug/metabolite transporter (DMT)-like permease